MAECPLAATPERLDEPRREVVAHVLDDPEGYPADFAARALRDGLMLAVGAADVSTHRNGDCDCPKEDT